MAKFAYNNIKNERIDHILFKLNCGYYSWMLYKKDIKPRFKSKSANKLLVELKELMIIYRKNLYYGQKH